MIGGHRSHPLWFAFALHRASGLLLALFLPLHFLVLGLAINGAEDLDGFLVLTHDPVVKFAEFGLVFLLAVHMFALIVAAFADGIVVNYVIAQTIPLRLRNRFHI